MEKTDMTQVVEDLRYVFGWFPLECLEHVVANRGRLIRGHYSQDGKGCLFNLLSEKLPSTWRINSRESLTRYFTGSHGDPARELPEYQPARWLVRLIDHSPWPPHPGRPPRYGEVKHLPWSTVIAMLRDVIAQRRKLNDQEQQVINRLTKMGRINATSGRKVAVTATG